MRRVRRIHFIGIGGTGMCGIAEVFLTLGFDVSGSDMAESAVTRHLQSIGAKVFRGHSAEQVLNVDVVVVSSAIPEDNPEVRYALAHRIPVVPRAQMLAELMRYSHGIAIAGTHGKTTTTSLTASLFAAAGLDPTFVIGGRLNSAGTNARLGMGRYLIAEADESDASFLHLHPLTAVVTNIEADHMSTYGGDFNRLLETFLSFLHNLPFYGLAVVCLDDPVIAELIPDIERPVITYGFSDAADIAAVNIRPEGESTRFDLVRQGELLISDLCVRLPGRHNVQNALAALAVGLDEGIAVPSLQTGLATFEGVGRRFQYLADIRVSGGVATLIDDYGHHPSEVRATIDAVREGWPGRRLVTIFQPHRYSRTQDLFDDFVEVLEATDVLILLDVYAAGEAAIPGAESRDLARALRQRGEIDPIYIRDAGQLEDMISRVGQDGDIVVCQGAGNVSAMAHGLKDALAS
jgi:UDP-N-acetylmuramate--alanine ligase